MHLRRRFALASLAVAAAALVAGCYDSTPAFHDRDYSAQRAKEQNPNEDGAQGGPETHGDMAGKGRGGEHKEAIHQNLHK